MKNSIKYLPELLIALDIKADDFYSISLTKGQITLQGAYNSEFVKKFSGWIIDGGYLKKKDYYIFQEEKASIDGALPEIKISYTIILTD